MSEPLSLAGAARGAIAWLSNHQPDQYYTGRCKTDYLRWPCSEGAAADLLQQALAAHCGTLTSLGNDLFLANESVAHLVASLATVVAPGSPERAIISTLLHQYNAAMQRAMHLVDQEWQASHE